MNDFSLILLAAGTGSRMNLPYNKILHKVDNSPLFMFSIDKFKNVKECKQIILVINELDKDEFLKYNLGNTKVVFGGKTRQESVYNGLQHVTEKFTVIHDSARPNFEVQSFTNMLNKTNTYKAMTLGVPVIDTIKRVNNEGVVVETLVREELMNIQTPQIVETSLFKEVHEKAKNTNYVATDDVSLVEALSKEKVHISKGTYNNVKITTIEDLKLFERK